MSGCPWDSFLPATIQFCETRLCSIVVEPANTWSNIGFVLVGIYIYLHAQKNSLKPLHYVGAIVFFEGLGSAFFHGSGTFIGEVADVGCMYFISAMFICIASVRLGVLQVPRAVIVFWLLVLSSTLLLITFKTIGIALFSLQVTVATILEIIIYRRHRTAARYKWLVLLMVTFALAFFFWNMDIRGIWCNPDNHIFNGHAAWHLLNAFAMYCYYQFIRQFQENGSWLQRV